MADMDLWHRFLADHDLQEKDIAPLHAALFFRDYLYTKHGPKRCDIVGELRNKPEFKNRVVNPFTVNPLPYGLLTRFAPFTFAEVWQKIREAPPGPARAQTALLLLVRADSKQARQPFKLRQIQKGWGLTLSGSEVEFPVTAETARILQEWTPDQVAPIVKESYCHSALFAELQKNKVPEAVVASMYGRWSAVKMDYADRLRGLFRTELDVHL